MNKGRIAVIVLVLIIIVCWMSTSFMWGYRCGARKEAHRREEMLSAYHAGIVDKNIEPLKAYYKKWFGSDE